MKIFTSGIFVNQMREKRRYPRVDLELPVYLRHNGRFIPATALNISCGGMYIKTGSTDISDNSPVEVIFDLDKETRDMSILGNIRHRSHDGSKMSFGIRFSNLFSVSKKTIDQFVAANMN